MTMHDGFVQSFRQLLPVLLNTETVPPVREPASLPTKGCNVERRRSVVLFDGRLLAHTTRD